VPQPREELALEHTVGLWFPIKHQEAHRLLVYACATIACVCSDCLPEQLTVMLEYIQLRGYPWKRAILYRLRRRIRASTLISADIIAALCTMIAHNGAFLAHTRHGKAIGAAHMNV
jgi:hypothetical protein